MLIDHVTARDAQLIIVPKEPGKEPKVWAIHTLELDSVGFNRSMPFTATLTNPIPIGEIATTGSFGPWMKGDPGRTPLSGRYSFEHADLSTIDGIGGILTSTGTFAGILSRIDVDGKTSTPDFRLDIGGQPVPLETTFHSVVDGTNGNTYLNQVNAMLGETAIEASGEVASAPHVKGRTVKIDMTIKNGRIEDLLQLAVQRPQAGDAGANRAAGRDDAAAGPPEGCRSPAAGRALRARARGVHRPDVRTQIALLSRRAQGKKADEPMGPYHVRHARTVRDGGRPHPLRGAALRRTGRRRAIVRRLRPAQRAAQLRRHAVAWTRRSRR